ncbi:odorant receptor 22c-like [Anopheles bellator]|uniref:odorant receptor 22c-like n=1 Tax=Anopheles bellator TaxID=139047 RepID=UPI002649370C|nr:odorant receptor 22c-like [Anopheles bellator]
MAQKKPASENSFDRLIALIAADMGTMGVNVLDPNWKPSFPVLVTLVLCIFQPYLSVVSLVKYRDSIEQLAEVLSTTMTYIQLMGRSQFYAFKFQREWCCSMVQNIRQQRALFGAKDNSAIEELFDRSERRLLILYRVLYWIYIATMLSFLTVTLVYPDPRKYNLLLAFQFPFLPVEQPLWWYFTYLYQCAMFWNTIHMLITIDGIMVMSLTSVRSRISALKLMLRTLDEKILAAPWQRTEHLEPELHRIIELHVSIKQFMKDLTGSFKVHFFLIFGTGCLEICTLLSMIAIEPRTPIYPYLAATTSQLFVMCFFGNLLLIENDGLADCVYCIHWYRLSVRQQKKIKFIIANAQPEMKANAILMPVTMASFVTVVRAGYSYFAILQRTHRHD